MHPALFNQQIGVLINDLGNFIKYLRSCTQPVTPGIFVVKSVHGYSLVVDGFDLQLDMAYHSAQALRTDLLRDRIRTPPADAPASNLDWLKPNYALAKHLDRVTCDLWWLRDGKSLTLSVDQQGNNRVWGYPNPQPDNSDRRSFQTFADGWAWLCGSPPGGK